ncbi:methionine--tRNA ligase [Candidatus Woesearchaeota archaeon CG06_land_8_20_14_3_00_33_13]|nr:MAG: methionine--tRNA ligase [Candidatus Woesearchaeota archaeon CG10_big_fil_rev_8_21_14_0_10_33_12]PIU72671.1 MAG: methionine--tRNA ligase [Candidatus Woesearchaeota archaeon CG06_land_8_20_14_3_00_33_13]
MSEKTKQKILVTSALPYVNNVPHIGNMVCVISADVYTRFLRLKGVDVISVLGTDEHGTTTETKAIEEGITPKEVCEKYFKIHKKIYDWFESSFDCFGRTSSKENLEITQDIFKKLNKNGFIKKDILEQAYCPKCKKFLADRFVEGVCPKCGYKDARGDQCENCGALLNATELVDAKCKICGTKPITKKSEHLFIDLPKLAPMLEKWVKEQSVKGKWSQNAKTMIDAWLRDGLKPRCITRDLKWGIPVPLKGFEKKVFYSWFDAPIGYIGITKECRKDWKEWWFGKDVRLVQFMGKDNIPFHTVLFPASLIGTKDGYILLDRISSNEYINYEGGQFSKSRGLGIFGDDAVKTGIKADAWRYYIMVNRPEKADTDFSWEDFQSKINNELVANFGNFINRTISFINQFYKSEVPEAKPDKKDEKLIKEINDDIKKITDLLNDVQLKEALKQIMHISRLGNQYFQEAEPWKKKENADTCLATCANITKDLAILIRPYMPETSSNIFKQLNIKELGWKDLGKVLLRKGYKINKPELLFNKLEGKDVERFKKDFGGKKVEGKREESVKDAFSKLDLKVAKIISVEDHPDADKLIVMKIDLGNEERQIVAGIKKYYSKEELIGRNLIVVKNLKPVNLRGKESNGMLLAAMEKKDDEENVKLLSAKNSSPGDDVFIEGIKKEPKKHLGYNEFREAEMRTDAKGHVLYNGKPLKTKKQKITVEGVKENAIVR